MNRVIVESPYAGEVDRNIVYARECLKHCLHRGEAPFASHLLYTQRNVLDDSIPEERVLGMEAGFEWLRVGNIWAAYIDLGVSRGMRSGYRRALESVLVISIRSIYRVLSSIETDEWIRDLNSEERR